MASNVILFWVEPVNSRAGKAERAAFWGAFAVSGRASAERRDPGI
jgi:hypothetical protein